jgi:hypothetical protein
MRSLRAPVKPQSLGDARRAVLSNAVVQVREAIRDLEQRLNLRFEGIVRHLETLDDKVSRQFVWLAGCR